MSEMMTEGLKLARSTFDEVMADVVRRKQWATFHIEIDVAEQVIVEVRKKITDRRRPAKKNQN